MAGKGSCFVNTPLGGSRMVSSSSKDFHTIANAINAAAGKNSNGSPKSSALKGNTMHLEYGSNNSSFRGTIVNPNNNKIVTGFVAKINSDGSVTIASSPAFTSVGVRMTKMPDKQECRAMAQSFNKSFSKEMQTCVNSYLQSSIETFVKGANYAKNTGLKGGGGRGFTSHLGDHVMTVAYATVHATAMRNKNGYPSEEQQKAEYIARHGTINEKDFVALKSGLRPEVAGVAAMFHDTGMGEPMVGVERDKNDKSVIVGHHMVNENNFNDIRANHAAGSSLYILQHMDFIQHGLSNDPDSKIMFSKEEVIQMAYIAYSHSKSSSGIKDVNSIETAKNAIDEIATQISFYNQNKPEEAERIDVKSTDLYESIIPNLGQVNEGVREIGPADANRIGSYGDTLQSGEVYNYDQHKIPTVKSQEQMDYIYEAMTAKGVDDKLYDSFADDMVNGQHNKPWDDVKILAYYETKFANPRLYNAITDETVSMDRCAMSNICNIGGQNVYEDESRHYIQTDGTEVVYERVNSEHGIFCAINELQDRIGEYQRSNSIPTEMHIVLPENCSEETREAFKHYINEDDILDKYNIFLYYD